MGNVEERRSWSRTLAPGIADPWPRHALRRLVLGCVLLSVVGGLLLSLPVSWHGHHPYESELTLTEQNLHAVGTHGLNCLFMAVAALTGTGLQVYDAGADFSRFGHCVLLVLMELGGLLWLTLSTAAGWRLRAAMGWGTGDEATTHRAMVRIVLVVLGVAIGLQLLGMLAFLPVAREGGFAGGDVVSPWFAALFTSVSAWTNGGLLLRPDAVVRLSGAVWTYVVLAGLMWLGALGGPVLYELLRRPFRRAGMAGWSRFLKLTVTGSVVMAPLGAGCVFVTESTTFAHWQLRYRAQDRPGHLTTSSESPAASIPDSAEDLDEGNRIVFSGEDSELARGQRLRSLPGVRRWGAALLLALETGSGGMAPVRLDDESIAPASRLVLTGMMFVGGPLGGMAGGVRLMTLMVLAAVVFQTLRDSREATPGQTAGRFECFAAAGVILLGMGLLVAGVTWVLVYRQPDSLERCLFDAVSACGNVGLSTGVTAALPYEDHTPGPLLLRLSGRLALIFGMLAGKMLPVAVILSMTRAKTASRPSSRA